ncbi:MAG: hypothetical protein HY534_07605 [Chloroflexi bacterium]|nr:hypothetical protein [Chloroflexota bacterium]
MELRDYLAVLRRRWLVVAVVFGLTTLVAVGFALRGPRSYEATLRLAVSVGAPPQMNDQPPYAYYREYYLWLASEYLADDLSEIIQSDAFARDLGEYLQEDVDLQAVRDVVRVRKTHRILEITALAPSAERARRMGEGIVAVVKTKGPKYVAELASPTGQVVAIDDPRVRPATTTGSLAADLALRGALALLVALFLAYFIDYLDSTLRTRRDIEQGLGLPVLGEIPIQAR